MRTAMMGVALIAALAAAPAIAKEKKALKDEGMKQSSSISQEDQNREQNADGTFQGKPVVQGPAKWTNLESSGSASTGASSGETGSASPGASSGASSGEAGTAPEGGLSK